MDCLDGMVTGHVASYAFSIYIAWVWLAEGVWIPSVFL